MLPYSVNRHMIVRPPLRSGKLSIRGWTYVQRASADSPATRSQISDFSEGGPLKIGDSVPLRKTCGRKAGRALLNRTTDGSIPVWPFGKATAKRFELGFESPNFGLRQCPRGGVHHLNSQHDQRSL